MYKTFKKRYFLFIPIFFCIYNRFMATEGMGEKNLMARKSGANGTLTICRPQENGRQTMKLPYSLF